MSLRGSVADFPLETIVQLVAATSKTGQLELRGDGDGGVLGFDAGRLVAATSGDDVGEPALGAVFATTRGDFEFVPWNDPPAANLSGDLEQLLDRAVQERDRIVTDRRVIPDDRTRFKLSDRAASKGEITMSSEQWRALLAVNGERDLRAVAGQLHAGRLATLALIAGLVRAGMVDTLEPAPEAPPVPEAPPAPPAPTFSEPAAATWDAPAPSTAPSWEAPIPAPPPAPTWDAPPAAPSWEAPPPATPAPSWEAPAASPEAPLWERFAPPAWERPQEHTPSLAERMAVLDTPPPAEARPAAEPPPAEADERLSALSGIFGAPPAPAAPEAPFEPAAAPEPGIAFEPEARPSFTAEEMATIIPAPVEEKKKPGLFGRFRREEPASAASEAVTGLHRVAWSQGGQLAAFANQLLAEYNSGQYGKGRVDERMTNLLMRVDEQADPIDRPLPVMDDRIDVQALERAAMPFEQIVPYLAQLVAQIHSDAEKAFGRDKAKKGYVAARQQVFGADVSALTGPAVAGKLPKV